jgi:hypothetical protein
MTVILAYELVLDRLREHNCRPKETTAGQATALCPVHEADGQGHKPSLSVTANGDKVLIHCHGECETGEILARIGLTFDDLRTDQADRPTRTVVAEYPYTDETGKVLYVKVRYDPKGFQQYVPQPDGTKAYSLNGVSRVLFNLPKLADATEVWIAEGEKDCLMLHEAGVVATTWDAGAWQPGAKPKWRPEYSQRLTGKHVTIVQDRDDAGRQTATDIADSIKTYAASVRIVEAARGNDAHDHLNLGGTVADFVPVAGFTEPRSWRPIDLSPVLDGTWVQPKPTVGSRTDGKGLLYPGKSHLIIGETEAGKGWFTLVIALQEMYQGHHVLYVDFEDSESTVVGRLLTISISRDWMDRRDLIRRYFHYVRPESPIGTTGVHRGDLREITMEYRPTLAVLDGITECMVMHDLNPLDNVDAAKFGRLLPQPLASTGAAVASLDHVTKSNDSRGRYALGAVHKVNALDGGALLLENRKPFGVGMKGVSAIKISKDRPGQLRANGVSSTNGLYWYGDLVLDSENDDYAHIAIYPPIDAASEPQNARPIELMKQISDLLAGKPDGLSQRMIRSALRGKMTRRIEALDLLILDGYVTGDTPHKLIRPFVEHPK